MKEKIVIFDIDGTLIEGQSQRYFIDHLLKKKFISLFNFLKLNLWFIFYKLGIINNPKSALEFALKSTKEKNVQNLEKIADNFFNEILVKKFYKNVLNILNEKKKDSKIFLMSNSFDFLVEKISKYVNADGFFCTKLERKDGFITGKIINTMYGNQKVEKLNNFCTENNYNLKDISFYSDHYSDIPVMSIVGEAIAVNPDERLAIYAKGKKWNIIYSNKRT